MAYALTSLETSRDIVAGGIAKRAAPEIRLLSMSALGPFSWRWPDADEAYERGWAAITEVDGHDYHVRHGVGRRVTFGRLRVRSVTWVEGQPMVEGVEADDYSRSECLLSLIKLTRSHLRPGDALPAGYEAFPVVVMADEATGPHSPRSLAVKLRQDDIVGWTRHALLRAAAWGRLRPTSHLRTTLPPAGGSGPAPAVGPATPKQLRQAVAATLLEYAKQQTPAGSGPALEFTPNPEANELLRTNPFAFLIAVLMDQGIVAERAWLGPYLLRQRLGHLDPTRFASDATAVREAVQLPPSLHRFIKNVPRWLVLAAQRVLTTYGGNAGAIWADKPSAAELQRRFDAFPGIGQKKAAMAVEILARDLGVEVGNLGGSDVAYDVHLRRVFLRTRLVDRDDRDEMIEVARQLNPTRPGALDLPAWLIGRAWCRPGLPDCAACPLTSVCPKDIERAAQVASV